MFRLWTSGLCSLFLTGLFVSLPLSATELADEEDISIAEPEPMQQTGSDLTSDRAAGATDAEVSVPATEDSEQVAVGSVPEEDVQPVVQPLAMLGHSVQPGELKPLSWSPGGTETRGPQAEHEVQTQ